MHLEATPQTSRNGAGARKPSLPPEWHNWPTATGVAKRLKCSRQHVYRLEERGDLTGVEGTVRGRAVRRFDPAEIEELEDSGPTGELVEELKDELADALVGPGAEKVIVRILVELRQAAQESRKGQHDAYQLAIGPTRELHAMLLKSLERADARIRELEEQVNRLHDAQRDKRQEDREFSLVEKQVANETARKEQFFKLLADTAPALLNQLVESVYSGKGPLAVWMSQKTPEQQQRLIGAIDAIMQVESEAAGSSPPPVLSGEELDPSSSPERTPQ